jgi:hypothetical protein
MSEHKVEVVAIEKVEPIIFSNKEGLAEIAKAIEVVQIGGYQSIVGKGSFKVGDLVAYIPCASIVPIEIQTELGVLGKLSGSGKCRVKEIRLKGVLSEGLVYPAKKGWKVGDNVAEQLGITKWEPKLPGFLSTGGSGKKDLRTISYDIENYKKYNRTLVEGELVVITSKLHGTYVQIGLFPDGDHFVTSKGLAQKGIILRETHTKYQRFLYKTLKFFFPSKFKSGQFDHFWSSKYTENLYLRTVKDHGLLDKLRTVQDRLQLEEPIYLMGEIFGAGIQDLTYGVSEGKPEFRAFDIYLGKKGFGHYLNYDAFADICTKAEIPMVPKVYQGPFSEDILKEHTNGKEDISGKELHIREGVVVKPIPERKTNGLGRVILKSVSADYLTRKNPDATEFN